MAVVKEPAGGCARPGPMPERIGNIVGCTKHVPQRVLTNWLLLESLDEDVRLNLWPWEGWGDVDR